METCGATGKRKLSKADANKQAKWWRRERLARMSAYGCRRCGGWHIGNSRPPRRGRLKR